MRRIFVLLSALSLACASTTTRNQTPVDVTPAHAAMAEEPGAPVCMNLERGEVCFVSFIHLLAHPEKYHGRRVQLVGYLRLEFEGNSLYLSRELYQHGATHDALWVDVDGMKAEAPFDEGWVLVEATFDAEQRGHFGMYAGSIGEITRLEKWAGRGN